MINHSKSILALINTKQGAQDFKIEQDVTDMTADDMVEIFVKMMEYQGYNDISIWRALVTAADEMVEKFDNIIETKEWQNEKKRSRVRRRFLKM
jgi:glycosylphosphatidylinositol transamidase (GPIT) subunit GPI8